MSTNDSVPEQIYDTSGLRHDVLQKIFPTSWASEYPGKPRLSRRERRNREQRRVIARKVAEVFDADANRRRTDHAAKLWSAAIGEIFSDGVKQTQATQADVDAASANLAAARERAAANGSGEHRAVASGGQSSDFDRNTAGEQKDMFAVFDMDSEEQRVALREIVDGFDDLVSRLKWYLVAISPVVEDTAFVVTHNSSPSVVDAGAHSVGDGPGAGDASATPATEVAEDSLHTRLTFIQIDEGKAEEIYLAAQANLADAAENLAHARNKTRDAETAYNDFVNGGAK